MWLLFGAPPAYVHHVVDNIVKQRMHYEVALAPSHHANWSENLPLSPNMPIMPPYPPPKIDMKLPQP